MLHRPTGAGAAALNPGFHHHRRRRRCDSSASLSTRCPRIRIGSRVVFAGAASHSSVLMLHSAASKSSMSAGRVLRRVLMSPVLCHSSWLASHPTWLWWWARSASAPSLPPLHASRRECVAGFPVAPALEYTDSAVFSRVLDIDGGCEFYTALQCSCTASILSLPSPRAYPLTTLDRETSDLAR